MVRNKSLSYNTRGGPLYFTNIVGPLNFVSHLLIELQVRFHSPLNLEAELPIDSSLACSNQEDILVDELKVFTDDELADLAFQESFKEEEESGAYEQQSKEH